MRRREIIAVLGGVISGWPLTSGAQQPEPMRRIGVLMNVPADHPTGQAGLAAFRQVLQQSGWSDGHNLRIDVRWGANDGDRDRRYAAELVALAPDVILAAGDSTVRPLLQATRTVPIVFSVVIKNPVEIGYIGSLARPSGNTTGYMNLEYGMGAKCVELLKEIAPHVTRVAVLRNSANASQIAQFGDIQTLAPALRVEVIPINMHDASEIEQSFEAFARSPNGGLFVTAGAAAVFHRDLIVTLAARHKLPAVYRERFFVAAGGLISYGADLIDQYRRAAGYVDRILKGEKPTDLPVQALTKYQTVINLNSAKELGLTVPQALLARADEMIE